MNRMIAALAMVVLLAQMSCSPSPPLGRPDETLAAICCGGVNPTPDVDYAASWVGTYNGASDVYLANTGHTQRNVSAYVTITREREDVLVLYLRVGTRSARSMHAVRLEPQSLSCLCGEEQSGNRRVVVRVLRNGYRLEGTIRIEAYNTSGYYILVQRYTVNVIA